MTTRLQLYNSIAIKIYNHNLDGDQNDDYDDAFSIHARRQTHTRITSSFSSYIWDERKMK